MKETLEQPSAPLSTLNAARWNVRVLADGTRGLGDEVWLWWNGITKFEPTQDQTTQSDTDIFSKGYKSSQVTATSEDVSVEGMAKGRRGSNGLVPLDPGTALVRSRRRSIGEDNEITLMYWRADELDEDTAIVQTFSVSWKDQGGSQEDLQKYTADLKGRGAPDIVARPAGQVHQLSVEQTVTGFTVSVGGTPTAEIDNDPTASAASIASAIEALTAINPGDVTVTPIPTPANAAKKYLIVFSREVGSVTATKTTGTGAVTVADPS